MQTNSQIYGMKQAKQWFMQTCALKKKKKLYDAYEHSHYLVVSPVGGYQKVHDPTKSIRVGPIWLISPVNLPPSET